MDPYTAHLLDTDPSFAAAWRALAPFSLQPEPDDADPDAPRPTRRPPPARSRQPSNDAQRAHNDQLVLDYLAQNTSGTARDISAATGIKRGTIDDVINRLVTGPNPRIQHIGRERHGTSNAKTFALRRHNTNYQDNTEAAN